MPAQDAESRASASAVFAALWSAAWRHRRRTLAALALLVAAKLSAVLVPLLLKAIVDRFSGPGGLAADVAGATGAAPRALVLPVFLLLGYALLRFAGTLFTELRDLLFARVTQRTVADFAERCFAHLLSLSPRFHLQRNTGSLIRDVQRGTAGIGFLLGAGLFTVVPTLVELVAVLLVMAGGYSLWFTAVIVLTFFLYAGYTMTLTQRRALRQRRVNELDSRASGRMVDSLLNYETVKTHAREAFERGRYAGVLAQSVDEGVRNQRALSQLHVGQSAIIAAGVAAVMLLAGEQTLRGQMTVGDLVLVNAYVIQICLPLNALGFVFREARDALVNTEKLLALLGERAEIVDAPGAPALAVRQGEVRFENVNFGYDSGRQILFDLGLVLPAGHTVAVVGGSGSGKSTLARLLLRLYEVQGGRITVDGQDLRAVRLDSLRQAVGIVPQDTVLFDESIAYNIAYGRPGASLPEVIEAAQAAQVHEFILSLPEQYETRVGERGLKLSGGEKQRIAIARAFLKNPPIMVFDEATSALDTRSERAIQSELDRVARGRSTLVIAHRLSTIVGADQIVVMDRGRIVERGRHEELLAQGGLYAQLWSLQRQQQEFERLERRLARQPVNLAVLVALALDGLRPALDARGVRLYSEIDSGNASVTGDPSTLAQIVQSLIAAALQATPEGGRIELLLLRAEANVRLVITDSRHAPAAGAPAAEAGARGAAASAAPSGAPSAAPSAAPAARAARAAQPGTETPSATPLDPLELRSLVERQGGRFEIETVSTGLRYTVELPLRAVEVPARPAPGAAAQRAPEQAPEGGPAAADGSAAAAALDGAGAALPAGAAAPPAHALALAGLRLACVDDDPEARAAVRGVLEIEGAQVIEFGSGREALDWFEHTGEPWPHALVCDIALGAEDGHEVVRRLRQLEARRGVPLSERIPAVALTGLARADDRVRALMAGFQVHLAKPADPHELVATLQALVQPGRYA